MNFSWTDNSGRGKALSSDQPILVVHCPELNQTIYTIDGVSTRSAGAAVLHVPSFSGRTVETWVGFVSANGRLLATSQYAGQVTVL